MADENEMLFIRGKNCSYCIHGYNGIGHMVDYAVDKGLWNITDAGAENANKTFVYDAIDQYNPFSVFGFGHGNSCIFTGDTPESIFTCDECSNLAGRVVYLISCLTGKQLCSEILDQGGKAAVGYNVTWTYVALWKDVMNPVEFKYDDPYDDLYAKGFWESANEFTKSLLDGKTIPEAVQACIDKYDEWIDFWFDHSSYPLSASCIQYLAYDRDGLVAFISCGAITDEAECLANGCHWHNNTCFSCEEITSVIECNNYGCYWYDGSCHGLGNICNWIEDNPSITIDKVFEIIDSYTSQTSPDETKYDFVPTLEQVFGVINYYLGYDGSDKTGCISCEHYTSAEDCSDAGCYWYGGVCHSELVCEDILDENLCGDNGCFWYNNSCHGTPQSTCEQLTNQTDCYAQGCYWYNGSCHDFIICSEINNDGECSWLGCYWHGSDCRDTLNCEDVETEGLCNEFGCYWYNNSCHADPQY